MPGTTHLSAVHTSAPPASASIARTADHAAQCVEVSGRLSCPPELRTRMLPDGHLTHLLRLELEGVGPGQHQVRAEMPFEPAHHAQVQALAHQLHRGQLVRVRATTSGMRWLLPCVVDIDPAPPTPTAPPLPPSTGNPAP